MAKTPNVAAFVFIRYFPGAKCSGCGEMACYTAFPEHGVTYCVICEVFYGKNGRPSRDYGQWGVRRAGWDAPRLARLEPWIIRPPRKKAS